MFACFLLVTRNLFFGYEKGVLGTCFGPTRVNTKVNKSKYKPTDGDMRNVSFGQGTLGTSLYMLYFLFLFNNNHGH